MRCEVWRGCKITRKDFPPSSNLWTLCCRSLPPELRTLCEEMTGVGRGAGSKQDDFQPQPVEEQLPGVECCINSPPKWRTLRFSDFLHRISRFHNRFPFTFFFFDSLSTLFLRVWCIICWNRRFLFHRLLMKCMLLMWRIIWWCCVTIFV